MTSIRLQPGPVTLYAQVASILRDRVVTGVWRHEEEIPTLDDLARQLSVARVTVRQAIQILSAEGLLSSQRGRRTYVTYDPGSGSGAPLFSSVGSVDMERAEYSVEILSRGRVSSLPPGQGHEGVPAKDYVRIRKVDSEFGSPYVASDNYVASAVAKRFPKGAEARIKVSRLVKDYAVPAIVRASESITVGSVTYDEAAHLQAPLSSTVARVTRIFYGPEAQILYFGTLVYRGERFTIERDISAFVRR